MNAQKFLQWLLIPVLVGMSVLISHPPAVAGSVDSYISRFIANEPVEVQFDSLGNTHQFTPEDLTTGKELFDNSCINCHAGGLTFLTSDISLSLEDLKAATPPRDTIDSIVEYMRYPVSYDGSDTNYWCRQVSENWMPQPTAEKLAAYILRSAEVAPGWGIPQKSPFDL